MAARKAEGKRRGHRAAVPPARPMRRHRPREGGKRSIGRERLPDSYVPPSPIPWKRARNQPGMYFVGNGRKIAHVANGVIRTGKNDSGGFPTRVGGVQTRLSVKVSGQGFPTRVGVFLNAIVTPGAISRLPHVRGGVSQHIFEMVGQKRSSPRTWGCFPDTQRQFHRSQVFPTHVGCFCQSFYLMKEPITASNGTPHTLLWILPAS